MISNQKLNNRRRPGKQEGRLWGTHGSWTRTFKPSIVRGLRRDEVPTVDRHANRTHGSSNFSPSVTRVVCRICKKSVDITGDDWNERPKDPCHRLCYNQPVPGESPWKGRSRMKDREDATEINNALERGYNIPDDKRRELSDVLFNIATTSLDVRAKMQASLGLLKLGVDIDKVNLEEDKFRDTQRRLDSGQPTEITSDPTRFQIEANSLLVKLAGENVYDRFGEEGVAEGDAVLPALGEPDEDRAELREE